jgi:uncharacterized protein YecT (DUF1311 family)
LKLFYLLASLLLLILTPVAASSNDEDCNYAGTQTQMNACAKRDYEASDKELNRVYGQLMRNLTPTKQKKLQKEQRAWLKERDPKCRKEANDEAEGGSMWPMLFDSCRETSTKARIRLLKQLK